MDVVTKGPVATAGSMLSLSKIRGTMDPTRAATDMEVIMASPTANDNGNANGSEAKVNLAITPMKIP